MADKTFIIHSDWLQNIAQMPLEQQDKIIAEMARDGKSSSQIAEILGCSKSAIDHSSAWKNRNKNEEKFEF